jgi:hypothetical protein
MDAIIITDKIGDEKNKKIIELANKYRDSLISQINKLTQDESKKQLIIQRVVDKLDKLIDKSYKSKKTLLILLKNNLLKELGKNIAYK